MEFWAVFEGALITVVIALVGVSCVPGQLFQSPKDFDFAF
jgi:hypothetical protein